MEDINIQFRNKLLQIFEFVDDFLKDHNIEYYACGGTALGAIRHKGLIPWDDDIDIYLKRADYDRLMQLNNELNEKGYNFVCLENNPDYYLPFGKIEDKTTTLWEVKEYPFVIGVYIDIFPLDFFDEEPKLIESYQEKYYRLFRKYQRTHIKTSISDLLNLVRNRHLYTAYYHAVSILYRPLKKYYYKKVLSEIEDCRQSNGRYCVCTPQWRGKIFESKWFANTIEYPFENRKIMVPKDYDSYLSLLYGDYMTPPPPHERRFAHDEFRYFIDLNERHSLENIQQLKKKK